MPSPEQNLALLSTIGSEGRLTLSLDEAPIAPPGEGEVVVRVEAAPINPSDLLTLMGPTDLSALAVEDRDGRTVLTAPLHPRALASFQWRLDKPVTPGNEGAGVVVQAGPDLQPLLGKKVSVFAGGMYCRYRTTSFDRCMVLPDDASAAEGAGLFTNPLTALGMVETMRLEGHRALIHTAAASNLGQMLVRICQADGVELVNVVRSQAQVDRLKAMGARHVVNSTAADFRAALRQAVAATGATIAFDAVGGGRLAHDLLIAMATIEVPTTEQFNFGSAVKKQVYVYGRLDRSPLQLDWNYGTGWSVGIFVMTELLQRVGPAREAELRARIVREMRTTFASHYSATIGLSDLLDLQTLAAIGQMATGRKYLLDPTRSVR